MTVAIIDGDELVYSVALSYQRNVYSIIRDGIKLYSVPNREYAIESVCTDPSLDIGKEVVVYPFEGYEERIDSKISRILALTKASDYEICLSGTDNFRLKFAKLLPYKGNRKKDKPVYHQRVRDYIISKLNPVVYDTNEADEVMVYLAKKHGKNGIICSTDKDLKTIPGVNFNIKSGKLTYVSQSESRYNFYLQMLIGDAVDNIPSPYMLGIAKAKAILNKVDIDSISDRELYKHVKEHYTPYLTATDSEGNYKTKWYSGQDVDEVLYEVANLLYMEHIPGGQSRWEIPSEE